MLVRRGIQALLPKILEIVNTKGEVPPIFGHKAKSSILGPQEGQL
jgi:hypothetical protein